MATAFITGGTGFVGSHLIEVLLRAGHRVRALVRSPGKAESLGISGVEWVTGDLGSIEALRNGAQGADVVFHVAGLVAARSLEEFLAVNRDGTARVLDASPEHARFVLVSSLAAGGPSQPGRPLQGDEPPSPVSNYGRSKLAAEDVVRAGSLPWVIVRPPAVYGPRDTEMLRVFKAAGMGVAPVFGKGDQQLSMVYGPDLVEAIAAAGLSSATEGRILYPAHPEVITSADTVRIIGEACGKRVRIIPIPDPIGLAILQVTGTVARLAGRTTLLTADKGNEFFQKAWTCSPARLEQLTGWKAKHDFRSGTAETAAWYRKHGWL
ncbi:MAG TPA: NAD(P)-dependent oxidoreductase [Gemmatimonadales bacterium]|nr:NAD(P)-dependent oxidoreductase [Gemmatimonadales bacterium]